MYKFRQYPFKRVVMNHNTFINCSGNIYLDWGYQTNVSNTNNIYVNCNVQAYPGISTIDVGEQDLDGLPMGLINLHAFPDPDSSYDQYRALPRKYLFEGNVVYWDPKLSSIVSTLNTNSVNGVTNWQNQMIIMNSPGNPTGSVYSKEELQKIAEIAIAEDIVILSDEIYEKLVYGGHERRPVDGFRDSAGKIARPEGRNHGVLDDELGMQVRQRAFQSITELDPHLSYAKVATACGFKGVVAKTQAEVTSAITQR